MAEEIYNKTVFKRFFEKNDPTVLAWADNVLSKISGTGILPTFIKKDSEDFQVFWGSICHLFALVVIYSRQYNQIDTNKILFELFIENRGLVTNEITTLEQMQYLFDNYVNEYRKRGRMDIVSKEGVILGELLRLIQYGELDEFIFALLMPRDTGWTLGYSSPTWNRTDTVLNISKGYEMTESVTDLSKYPLINPTGIIIVDDTDNDGNPIKAMSFVGNTLTGISSAEDKSKLLTISEDLAYQIQFKIKVSSTTDQKIHFGVQTYDELQRPISCVEAFTISGQSPIESNNFVKNTDGGTGNLNFPIPNIYYQCTGTISKVNRSFSEEVKLNFPYGRGLKFQTGAKYLSLELTQDRTTATNAISGIYIYDIKIKPIYLPFNQGYLGEKNVIASYFKNNSLSSNNTVKQFIETYLISYKNIFGGSEIFKNELVLVRFKVFSDRGVYIQGASISINNETLTTDINGEASMQLYPGDYLMSVDKDKFIPIVDQLQSVFEQEEQIIYIPLQGELYERKITFAVRDENNLPVAGANITFNGKFATTGSDGTAVFYAYPDLYPYTVEKDKYYKVEKSILVQDDMIEEVTLQLIPIYTLTFIVKHGDDPVPDAIVTIGGKTAQTDSTGTAIIRDLLGGTYKYSVEKKDWLPVSETITVNADATIDVALNPVPTYNIIFLVNDYNVTTGEKTPLNGATISYAGITKVTGEDGTASFIVKEGSYDYTVSYTNHVTQSGTYAAVADDTKIIDLPQNQHKITIKVLGAGGVILRGATVQIGNQTLVTGSDGTAVFNLTNGNYTYKVNYTEYHEKEGDFAVNNADQTITVDLDQKTYAVTFTVRQEGAISSGATVTLGSDSQLTDNLGQVVFYIPVSTTPYSWTVSKTDYVTQSGSIDMTGTPISREINLVRKTSVVTFYVTDDNGSAVSGATVVVAGQTRSTGANGRIEFTIAVGSYDYTVSKLPDYQEQSGNVRVIENDQTVNVVLSNKVYNIIVTVKSPKNRNISGASVSISGKSGSTNSSGQVTLTNFKNGTYGLSVSSSGYNTHTENVTVSGSDAYVTVTLTYILDSGTITVYKEGSVLVSQSVSIEIYDRHGDYYNTLSQYTNSYGRVSFSGPSGGTSYVSVNNSECVALEDVSVSNGGSRTLYLWKALILTFNNSTSTPSGLSSSDWDRNGNDVRCCPGAKNNPSSVSSSRLTISCSGMTRLISIKQWPVSFSITGSSGSVPGSGNYGVFKNCTGLTSIASGSPHIYGGVIEWFMGCTSLQSIPSGLFLNMTGNAATSAFRGCTSLISTSTGPLVPLGTVYHTSMFRECSKLTTIGDSIFGQGGGTDDFHAVFMDCKAYTNSSGFQSTNSPFKRSTNAIYMQWTFANCSNLSTASLLWFRYCTKVQSFESCFESCTNLRTYSMAMFAWSTSLTRMKGTFYNCTYLSAPDAGVSQSVTIIDYIFGNCKSVFNLDQFYLSYHTNLQSAAHAFEGSGVEKTSYRLFRGCNRLTNLTGAFKNCTNLKSFGYNGYYTPNPTTGVGPTEVHISYMFEDTAFYSVNYPTLDCTEMFLGCSNLQAGTSSIGGYLVALWVSNGKGIGKVKLDRMFYGCSNLNEIPCYRTDFSTAGANYTRITDSSNSNVVSHSQTFTGTNVASMVPSGWA